MAESRRARLLWVDLEMTGLDPARDKIIEVGAIATDFDFHQVADYQASIKVSPELMRRRMVGKFWEEHDAIRQALMERSSSTEALPTGQVENTSYLISRSIWRVTRFIKTANLLSGSGESWTSCCTTGCLMSALGRSYLRSGE